MIAGLIVMVVLVGTAAANGGADSMGASRCGRGIWNMILIRLMIVLHGGTSVCIRIRERIQDHVQVGCGGRVYVVDHRDTWTNGTPLHDVSSDGYEIVAWDNYYYRKTWPQPLTSGTYDLILDLNVSGYYHVWTHIPSPYPGPLNITDPIWTIYVKGNSRINVDKTASISGSCPGADPLPVSIGDTVAYCFNVTNTGDVTITNIRVLDDIYGAVSLGTTTLGPGDSTGGTKTHLVAESDIPQVINNATVTGTDPEGSTVTDTETCTVNVEQQSGIDVNKTASPTAATPGTDVTFTIDVTNIGNRTLNPVRVEDTLPTELSYVASRPEADYHNGQIIWTNVKALYPGESTIITLVAHIEPGASGRWTDIVNVSGTSPTGENVTDTDTASVRVRGPPPTPAQVPEFTSVGLIALMGLLSVIAALNIKQKNE